MPGLPAEVWTDTARVALGSALLLVLFQEVTSQGTSRGLTGGERSGGRGGSAHREPLAPLTSGVLRETFAPPPPAPQAYTCGLELGHCVRTPCPSTHLEGNCVPRL